MHQLYIVKSTKHVRPRKPIGTTNTHHATVPIGFGPENAATFAVSKLNHPNCRLATGLVTTYRVMKILSHDRSSFQFVAIHGTAHFTKSPRIPENIFGRQFSGQTFLKDYIGQIAVALCRQGKIDFVKVGDKRNHNARQCGIATVLSELCLLDPEIHERGERNAAYKMLQKNKNQLEVNCIQLVGLQMSARPLTGAHAYFSAAINTGFNKLIVIWWGFRRQSIYDTVVAKQHYDGNTGYIEPCCQNEYRCFAEDAFWIFCKER